MRILILGGNYGLLFAGLLHQRNIHFDVFVTDAEKSDLNSAGFLVKSKSTRPYSVGQNGTWKAISEITETNYDLVVLAMQEMSFSSPNVRRVVDKCVESEIPFLNLMNIPLPAFLIEELGVLSSAAELKKVYTSLPVLSQIKSSQSINSSPEPQIFRGDASNTINLRLGGKFRCSNLAGIVTAELRELLLGPMGRSEILPVQLKEYQNPWPSVSKWPMLIAGNYRCIHKTRLVSIADAIAVNEEKSRAIYTEIVSNMQILGAPRSAIIPFERYLRASRQLDAPSSVARAIKSGVQSVERVDKLLLTIFSYHRLPVKFLSEVVEDLEQSLRHES